VGRPQVHAWAAQKRKKVKIQRLRGDGGDEEIQFVGGAGSRKSGAKAPHSKVAD
jgi:hypothetical protein